MYPDFHMRIYVCYAHDIAVSFPSGWRVPKQIKVYEQKANQLIWLMINF